MQKDQTPCFSLSSERTTTPSFALVFYSDDTVATLHGLSVSSDQASIGPGRFLLQDDLAKLGQVFSGASEQRHYMLPDRVLGAGPDFLTWYRPGALLPMRFFMGGVATELTVIWPSLIFHAWKQQLYAVAYLGSDRPQPDTRVFLPCLMNFYDSTAMCRGNASYPSSHCPSTIPEWEFAVYGTAFTHINNSGKIRGRQDTDDAHLAFWRHPARAKYPVAEKYLVPVDWAPTCGDWLDTVHDEDGSYE